MFLYTRQQHPLIAEKDLTCYVYIRKELVGESEEEHGIMALYHKLLRKGSKHISIATKYYEPFRNVKLRPNSLAIPKNTRVYSGEFNSRNHYRVDDGYINGMLRENYYGVAKPYNAIIPAGSEYYLNNGIYRVASNKMQILGPASLPLPPLHETLAQYLPQLAEDAFGHGDEVKPGFYYTVNRFINPNKASSEDLSSITGIVTQVDDNVITVMSLDERELIWCPENKYSLINKKAKSDGEHRYNEMDTDGENNTLNILRSDVYDVDFSAVNFCNNYNVYGGMSGRWYLGSSAEVIQAVRNHMQEINIAIAMLGNDYPLLDALGNYWTSTEYDNAYALSVDGTDGTLVASSKSGHCKVRAFMKVQKQMIW